MAEIQNPGAEFEPETTALSSKTMYFDFCTQILLLECDFSVLKRAEDFLAS